MNLTKVFYDGKCGLCSKEINYYKRIAPKNTFEWHDIASNPEKLKELHVSQYDALMYLHAIDQKSNLKIGLDAFILIWSHLKHWKILSTCHTITYLQMALYLVLIVKVANNRSHDQSENKKCC